MRSGQPKEAIAKRASFRAGVSQGRRSESERTSYEFSYEQHKNHRKKMANLNILAIASTGRKRAPSDMKIYSSDAQNGELITG